MGLGGGVRPRGGSGRPIGGSGSAIGGSGVVTGGRVVVCAAAAPGKTAIASASAVRVLRISYDYTAAAPVHTVDFRHSSSLSRYEYMEPSARRRFAVPFAVMDFKLGVRMLVKYPGLTLVGALAMSVAIAIGAGTFTFFYAYMNPPLPLDEGDRVIAIEHWDAAANRREDRSLRDFVGWRDQLTSILDVGAYREITRNVFTEDGAFERERVAEMTASGFRLARIAPSTGRYLTDEDERRGAPPVIVIG